MVSDSDDDILYKKDEEKVIMWSIIHKIKSKKVGRCMEQLANDNNSIDKIYQQYQLRKQLVKYNNMDYQMMLLLQILFYQNIMNE